MKRFLWELNIAVRSFLASIAPFWFSPSLCTLLLSGAKAQLSYGEMVERTRATTRRLFGLCACVVLVVLLAVKQGLVGL